MSAITVCGGLSDDPKLEYVAGGHAVCTFPLGEKLRLGFGKEAKEEWVNYRCKAWNQLAENLAGSLAKGDRVIIVGRFRSEEFEIEGKKRKTLILEVEECAPSLRWATTIVEKNERKER